ncbi:MAG TPA: M23 family metallopeptidase [Gammaproteobacteria bacterium]
MGKFLAIVIVVLVVAGAGAAWVMAGRAEGPVIEITEPTAVGQIGELAVSLGAPDGRLTQLEVVLEQEGASQTIFSLAATGEAGLTQDGPDRMSLRLPLGKRDRPDLRAGTARVTITAARPVLFGYREAVSTATHEFEVRLAPPQTAVVSQFHYVNHGGSEMIVYRVNSADAESGVRVGEYEYPGFPASGAGIAGADPALRVAFFALLWNQPVDTPITLFARDKLGNESVTRFDYRVFPKTFRHSRIEVDDRFLSRVVPAILQNTPNFRVDDPNDLLASYLRINRDMRKENNAAIAALAAKTSPQILWKGPFKQLVNTAVESSFADQRTYLYKGEEVDQQVHLGFDLASVATAPVTAANSGKVVFAGWLGIYGNCVVLDHGMGLQSLYAHLSSIEVAVGDMVEMDQRLGRSGTTGLAGGDHLHFTMLLNGHAVTPVDWWSEQWVQDRITRKLREAEQTL